MAAPDPPPARDERLRALASEPPSVVVVGGGITGAGIAFDLALRGVRVALFEQGDWGSATSSASSRLVHGGLRYLEQGEVGLVRESCLERALLLRNAAGLVWPEKFVFPVRRGDRVGRLKLLAGLWLYTALSVPRALGLPGLISQSKVAKLVPGIATDDLLGGGVYLDGATDDARLTLAVVLSALHSGVLTLSRARVEHIEPSGSGATVRVRDLLAARLDPSAPLLDVPCKAVVLAGGPFTEELRGRASLGGSWLSPTRGSHILVPRRRLPTEGAVIFASPVDGRVMFLIPWPRYTVIGTTDLDAKPGQAIRATREEVRYLLDSANGLNPAARLAEDDVVSTWAGLRPLLAAPGDDPSQRSREERVEHEGPVFTIAGGKLTGFRAMAEKLCPRIVAAIGEGDASKHSPTRTTRLWGAFSKPVTRPVWSSPGHPGDHLEYALTKRYGLLRHAVRDHCRYTPGAGRELDPETMLGEVDWGVRHEDCLSPVDFFFRRTDLGYGPRDVAEDALTAVLDRMGHLLGWSEAQWDGAQAELRAELDARHAWRGE